VEFGTDLSITYVMGGLAREFADPASMIVPWLDASERSGMPVDPRLWSEAPLSSSYPACMAVKAAAEQGPAAEGRYLRALREGDEWRAAALAAGASPAVAPAPDPLAAVTQLRESGDDRDRDRL
jgi:hypothetical protein